MKFEKIEEPEDGSVARYVRNGETYELTRVGEYWESAYSVRVRWSDTLSYLFECGGEIIPPAKRKLPDEDGTL